MTNAPLFQFEAGYALLIGVNENAIAQLALPDVAQDIAALRNVLIHPERCAYSEQHVRVITGSQATRQGILDGIEWLHDKLQADESDNATAVVYYSGHGWQDSADGQTTYYLIPYDMQQRRYRLQALRAADFAGAIDELNPRRLLVILDCCHAAGMDVKEMQLDAAPRETAIPPRLFVTEPAKTDGPGAKDIFALAEGKGRAILSSSQGAQKSYIRSDHSMSIFTYHLIEALTGYAQPQTGATEVLVSDVMGHVHRTVPKSALLQARAEQTPDYQISGNFPVALLLGGKGLSKGEAPPDPAILGGQPVADRSIHTGGGADVGGDVKVEGGDFVGRDKIIQGDNVTGTKIEGHIGNVGPGGQAAIGTGIRQTISHAPAQLGPAERKAIEEMLAALKSQVERAEMPLGKKEAGKEFVAQLDAELTKREGTPDGSMIKVAGEWLLKNVPEVAGTLTSLFASPIIGKVVEASGEIAAQWVKDRFGSRQ